MHLHLSPLIQVEDAIVLDNSELSKEEQLEWALNKVFDIIPSKPSSKIKGIGVEENQSCHYTSKTEGSLDVCLGTQLLTSVEVFLVVLFLKFFLSISMDNFDGLESLLSVASTLTVGLETFSES